MTLAELRKETGVPVVIVDQNGVIAYINPRFESAYGWTPKQLVGSPLPTIIPDGLHDAHNLGFSRFLATRQSHILDQPLNLKIRTADGREVDAEHRIIAENANNAWTFGATIRPL